MTNSFISGSAIGFSCLFILSCISRVKYQESNVFMIFIFFLLAIISASLDALAIYYHSIKDSERTLGKRYISASIGCLLFVIILCIIFYVGAFSDLFNVFEDKQQRLFYILYILTTIIAEIVGIALFIAGKKQLQKENRQNDRLVASIMTPILLVCNLICLFAILISSAQGIINHKGNKLSGIHQEISEE